MGWTTVTVGDTGRPVTEGETGETGPIVYDATGIAVADALFTVVGQEVVA